MQEDKIQMIMTEIANCVLSIVLEEGYTWSKEKIKEKLNQKNNIHSDYITKMYEAVVNALNRTTYNTYSENHDLIYEMAEKIVNSWRTNGINASYSITQIFKEYNLNNDKNGYQNFTLYLYDEITKNTYLKEHYLVASVSNIYDAVGGIGQKVDNVRDIVTQIGSQQDILTNKLLSKQPSDKANASKRINNCKNEYIEKWNSRLFLHKNDNKNLTLKNTFIMPCYQIIKKGILEAAYKYDLDAYLNAYFSTRTNVPIIIEGPPGIGKTSISAWIANKYCADELLYILKFRDWEKEDLSKSLMTAILSTLNCNKSGLNQKILILDGFDEIKSLYMGDKLITDFTNDIKDIPDIKVVITSRTGYFSPYKFNLVIKLHSFNNQQIRDFYFSITQTELPKKRNFENDEVLGIPVILYMAISTNIDITPKRSKGELYNKIFAKDGGIFDRFSFDEIVGYDYGNQILRIANNTNIFLDFLRNIAGEMLKKDSLKLRENEYTIPELDFQDTKIKVLDFPIKNLFEKESELEFVHTSIFDYFASEKIFELLDICINNNSKIDFIQEISLLFHNTIISDDIWSFFRYKIQTNSKYKNEYKFIYEILEQMTQEGMLYQTGQLFKNHLKHEAYVFYNFLNLLSSWKTNSRLKMEISDTWIRYLKLTQCESSLSNINLRNMDFDKCNFRYFDLSKIDFTNTGFNRANLHGVKLIESNLFKAGFVQANLTNCDFRKAKLIDTDLRHAILTGADLRESDLTKADFSYARLQHTKFHGAKINETVFSPDNISFIETYLPNQIHNTKIRMKNGAKISYAEYNMQKNTSM